MSATKKVRQPVASRTAAPAKATKRTAGEAKAAPQRAAAARPKESSARGAAAQTVRLAGAEALVNQYLAAYIMGVSNRLTSGASNYYRKHFNLGMSEWRAMMALGEADALIVREVAKMADLDHAAASKSVRLLEKRGFVSIEQTLSQGRAAIVRLTKEGTALYAKLRESSQRRQQKLLAGLDPAEVEMLWRLLRKVEAQVPRMNAD